MASCLLTFAIKMPTGQSLGLGVFVRNVPSVARNGENPDIDRDGSIQDYAEMLKDVKSKKCKIAGRKVECSKLKSRTKPRDHGTSPKF